MLHRVHEYNGKQVMEGTRHQLEHTAPTVLPSLTHYQPVKYNRSDEGNYTYK